MTESRGLNEEDFRRIATGGIDDRLNSYPWSMEQFDGDKDGIPEIYIGTLNNALCIQAPGMAFMDFIPGYEFLPPERWQCPNELWDPDDFLPFLEAAEGPVYVFQGRYDKSRDTWNWQRVWEPDLETEVSGFRGARVFNGALYMLAKHDENPGVWKTTDGIHYERASPPGMGVVGGVIPPGFRAAQVFRGRLCIASDQAAAVYCSSDPSTDPESWEQVNSTGFVDSGGEVHERTLARGRVTLATENTLTDSTKSWTPKRFVGQLVRITWGRGFGQTMQILDSDRSTVTIEGAWKTTPDSTSRYRIYIPAEPDSGRIWQMAVFNDHLYAIAFNIGGTGPALWKSADPAPGNWTRVIGGGFGNPSIGFMSLRPFRNHLYVGTGTYPPLFIAGSAIQGCEILRVDAQDRVELVVGKTRPAGVVGPDPVEPISGLERGFGYLFNFYSWYMGEHRGWFYVGTSDFAGLAWDMLDDVLDSGIPPEYQWLFDAIAGPTGFDMWRTRDGVEWFKVTETGFGEHDNSGVRNLLSTPWGFLVGTANAVDGFDLWLGRED